MRQAPPLALSRYLFMNPHSHSFWLALLVSPFHRWGNRGRSPFEGLSKADSSGAEASSLLQSVLLLQREKDLPGRNKDVKCYLHRCHCEEARHRLREVGTQAVLLSEPPALPPGGRPGRRWAHRIPCGPLPSPMSASEEHDSPYLPICFRHRL